MLYDNYKHSASSGNMWLDSPSAFIWRYGFKNWGKDSPRANMGKAVEQAVFAALENGGTPDEAANLATQIFDRMHDGEVHEERGAAGPIARQMVAKLLPLGKPLPRELRSAVPMPGLGRLVSYEADLIFPDRGIVDLKATMRMPWADGKDPAPRWSHVRQQGLYATIRKLPVSLLYATPKRCELTTIAESTAAQGASELLMAFGQIERWADKFPTPEQAVAFIPLQLDSFWWQDDPEAVSAAQSMWRRCNG